MVISAEKKNKAGKRGRVCWWRGRVAVLNRMVRKCLMEQVTSVQRSEGGKGVSCDRILRKRVSRQREQQMPCSKNILGRGSSISMG